MENVCIIWRRKLYSTFRSTSIRVFVGMNETSCRICREEKYDGEMKSNTGEKWKANEVSRRTRLQVAETELTLSVYNTENGWCYERWIIMWPFVTAAILHTLWNVMLPNNNGKRRYKWVKDDLKKNHPNERCTRSTRKRTHTHMHINQIQNAVIRIWFWGQSTTHAHLPPISSHVVRFC